jgi:malonyl-CoA/methylmalonyl-CoA synthetase
VHRAPGWQAHLPPGVPEVDLAEGGSLPGAWRRAWAAAPGQPVLTTLDGDAVSAGELAERSTFAAARFAAAGLAPGDRLLLCGQPSIELVVAYLGALQHGLVVVPANPAYTERELAALAAAASPAAAVLDAPYRLRLDPACVATTPDLASLPAAGPPSRHRCAPGDPALLIFTSGTTGQPKGVPLTHANLLATAHAVRVAWRWTPEDRLALCLPLFHVHGLGVGLHGTLVAGASAVLLPRFDPARVAAAIGRCGATLFFGVPTMYARLADSGHLAELSRLRLAVSGSAPLSVALHEAVRAGSGQVVLERYGMTEAGMLVSNPYEGERRPGTVGLPLPGVAVRLAGRPDGSAEIEVRGPNVVAGYLDDPGATAAAYTPDGWLRTGDLGTLDEDGYLRISGRAKELIISGGYNIFPPEVEEVLRTHPGVADAAVAGAASPTWGEVVVAFIVPGEGADPATLPGQLSDWCARHLADYKRPRQWRLVDAIPRTALGKIQRDRLAPPRSR